MNTCKIIAIANQKGGTGKTTTTNNLGTALANLGKRVLLVDNDPQGNLSTVFGVQSPDELSISLHELLTMLMNDSECVLPDKSSYILHGEKVDLIPANIKLALTEINLRNEWGGEHTLSALLEPLKEFYDYILIDNTPSIGMLAINALTACNSVIIPVSPEFWSATGLTALLNSILKVQKRLNPHIKVSGILITMADERTVLFRESKELINEYFAGKIHIFNTLIPNSTKVGRANFYSCSIMEFAPKNKAACAYTDLAREVLSHGECSTVQQAQTPA